VIIEYGAYPNGVGNLNLKYASATIRHCTFRNSGKYGLATDYTAWVDVSDSTFTGNALGAIYFRDASVNQVHTRLTIQDNGASNDKNFVVLGGGTIRSNVGWPAWRRRPYLIEGDINVVLGSSPRPWKEVRPDYGLNDRG
jgi:hypothetical protein